MLSIVVHLRRGYRPADDVLVAGPDGGLERVPVADGGQAAPGLVVYRFTSSLYYANIEHLAQEVRGLVEDASPPVRRLCVDASVIQDVDFSAAETLLELQKELAAQGVELVFAEVDRSARRQLDRHGVTAAIGESAYFDSVDDVIAATREA